MIEIEITAFDLTCLEVRDNLLEYLSQFGDFSEGGRRRGPVSEVTLTKLSHMRWFGSAQSQIK